MKKIKNRLLSLLLSVAVLLSMVPSALASGTGAQATAAGDSIIIQDAVHHDGSNLCYGTGNGV